MGEHSPDDNIIFFKGGEDDLTPDDKMLRFVDDSGLVPSSSGTVYDRTTVLIEQDPGTLEDEDDDGQCGEHLPFLVEGEEGFLIDQEAMSQGYVQHIISPDQIHLTINPGSTPMPRNIEGATLTLQSECPETKRKEVSKAADGPGVAVGQPLRSTPLAVLTGLMEILGLEPALVLPVNNTSASWFVVTAF
ncbi:hypothetical protein STEG23_021856 [Scotinomys teguina]